MKRVNIGENSGSSETSSMSESSSADHALNSASDSLAPAGPLPSGPIPSENQSELQPKPQPKRQKEEQKHNSPRPVPGNQSQLQPRGMSAQSAMDEYIKKMRKLFDEQNVGRPGWQRPMNRDLSDTLKALQNTSIPKLLFKLYRKHGMQFLNMPPTEQLKAVQKVASGMKKIARQLHTPEASPNSEQSSPTDLNDLTNPLNMQRALGNGDSVVSQNAAAQNGTVQAQNNEVAEEILVEDQQQAAHEHSNDASLVVGSAAAVMVLTTEEISEIETHNQTYNTPRPEPKPNTHASQTEEEEHNEAGKLIKHESEEISAEDLAKNTSAEKNALEAVLKDDKASFINAAKGIEKTVESGLEHAAGSALSSLAAAAA